jgi:hypothetical protein
LVKALFFTAGLPTFLFLGERDVLPGVFAVEDLLPALFLGVGLLAVVLKEEDLLPVLFLVECLPAVVFNEEDLLPVLFLVEDLPPVVFVADDFLPEVPAAVIFFPGDFEPVVFFVVTSRLTTPFFIPVFFFAAGLDARAFFGLLDGFFTAEVFPGFFFFSISVSPCLGSDQNISFFRLI